MAWDTERDDWRTFRVDRIGPRTPTGPRFTPREFPGDVAAYVARGVSSAAYRFQARIIVHAPAEVVAARINPAIGVVEALGKNSCVLATGADSVETVAVYAGLLDVDFTVSEPPELVERLRMLADRYQRAVDADVPPPGVLPGVVRGAVASEDFSAIGAAGGGGAVGVEGDGPALLVDHDLMVVRAVQSAGLDAGGAAVGLVDQVVHFAS